MRSIGGYVLVAMIVTLLLGMGIQKAFDYNKGQRYAVQLTNEVEHENSNTNNTNEP